MFPLAAKTFPQNATELAESIETELRQVLTFGKMSSPVTVTAPQYPHVRQFKVDLSHAQVTADEPPPPPKPSGKRQKGIEVDQLEVTGHPILYQTSKVNFDLKGKNARFDFARDKKGNALLVLADASSGNVDVNVTKSDLHSLALAAAGVAARHQGVTIQDVDLELTSQGERAVSANVRVKARKLLVSGVVRVTGRLDVDDALNATLSDLSCIGEGMIGNMVAGFVQPKLTAYNGKKIPLVAFSLGDLALSDLKIDVKNGLHVSANFGK